MNDTFYNLPAEKQEAVIRSCQQEFTRYGYENASTNRIVKNAGISKGSLFQYFASKEDLYLFILDQAAHDNLDYLLKNLDRVKGDLVDRIIAMSEISMEYLTIDPSSFRMYLTVDMNPDPSNTLLTAIMEDMLPKYTQITKKIFADIDTSRLRMSLDKTFNFIKLPLSGFKLQFFNKSRMTQDVETLKKEFMEGIRPVVEFIRHAIYKDEQPESPENSPDLKEADMVLIEAGLDVLYTLMSVDNEIHQTELNEIMKFLLKAGFNVENNQEKSSHSDFEQFLLQMGTLSALSREELHKRCLSSVQYIHDKADIEQKQKLLEYALNIILADGKITQEEKELAELVASLWDLDISPLLAQANKIGNN